MQMKRRATLKNEKWSYQAPKIDSEPIRLGGSHWMQTTFRKLVRKWRETEAVITEHPNQPSSEVNQISTTVMAGTLNTKNTSLPPELLLDIFSMLVPHQWYTPALSPFTPFERSTIPDLCSAARVCQLWSRCAQTVLFKDAFIHTELGRTSFNRAVEPASERGRWLGGLVVSLTIAYWDGQPSTSPGLFRLSPRSQETIVEQIIQRCTNLESLSVKHVLWQYKNPNTMQSWVTDKLKVPTTVRHLDISLTDWRCCTAFHNFYANSAVYKLIARTSILTSLNLETRYDTSYSPPLPPRSALSKSIRLVTFRAYQLDQLSEWILQHSKDTLKELALVEPTDLRKLGRAFPNVTTLKIGDLFPGNTLEEFKQLESLDWSPDDPVHSSAFLHRLPPSLRQITTNLKAILPELQAIIDSGALPNLESARYVAGKTIRKTKKKPT